MSAARRARYAAVVKWMARIIFPARLPAADREDWRDVFIRQSNQSMRILAGGFFLIIAVEAYLDPMSVIPTNWPCQTLPSSRRSNLDQTVKGQQS